MTIKAAPLEDENPKVHPAPTSNTEKNPDDWVSGDDAMTGAQASYLKTLSEQLHKPDAFDSSLTKADASKRIDALKAWLAKECRCAHGRSEAAARWLEPHCLGSW
jgi:hypothetical protein